MAGTIGTFKHWPQTTAEEVNPTTIIFEAEPGLWVKDHSQVIINQSSS